MTIQEGNINRHLDNKPPKDKVFIWSVLLIVLIISALVMYIINPYFIPDLIKSIKNKPSETPQVVTKKKETDISSIISDNLELNNVTKEEATVYYKRASKLSLLLEDNDYYFTDGVKNIKFVSPFTKNEVDFPIWFIVYNDYDKDIPSKTASAYEMNNAETNLTIDNIKYTLTNKKFSEASLKAVLGKYFSKDLEYVHPDTIEYQGCYMFVYNEAALGYSLYQKKDGCDGTVLTTTYKLTKAEIIEDYLYLYESDGKNEFMYTLINEDGEYKFLMRTSTKATEEIPEYEEEKDESIEDIPEEEPVN